MGQQDKSPKSTTETSKPSEEGLDEDFLALVDSATGGASSSETPASAPAERPWPTAKPPPPPGAPPLPDRDVPGSSTPSDSESTVTDPSVSEPPRSGVIDATDDAAASEEEAADSDERAPEDIDLPPLPPVDPPYVERDRTATPPPLKEPMPSRPPTLPDVYAERDRRRFGYVAAAAGVVVAALAFTLRCEDGPARAIEEPTHTALADGLDQVEPEGRRGARGSRAAGGRGHDGSAPAEADGDSNDEAAAAAAADDAAPSRDDEARDEDEDTAAPSLDEPADADAAQDGSGGAEAAALDDDPERSGGVVPLDSGATSKKKEPDPETAKELLEASRKALARGDGREAYRLAALAQSKAPSDEAVRLKTLAACKMGNKSTAKTTYRQLPRELRGDVRRACRDDGVWLI